jgi:hypothetical protein
LAFTSSGIRNIAVDSESRFFRVSGDFLIDLAGICVVRYFGQGGEATLDGHIVYMSAGCSSGGKSVLYVRFAAGCRNSILGELAFQSCRLLQSICDPSSIETIPRCCFAACQNLSNLIFEPGSRVSVFEDGAFGYGLSLLSICMHASLRQGIRLSMAHFGIRSGAVDRDHPFFRVAGDFLVDLRAIGLLWYFGNHGEAMIWSEMKALFTGCFQWCA